MHDSAIRCDKMIRREEPPFVVLHLPFVGLAPPPIKPFVGVIIPPIGFRRIFGFTAIELLVTVVIASILLTLALPNLRVFIQNNRLRTEASEFVAAINYART